MKEARQHPAAKKHGLKDTARALHRAAVAACAAAAIFGAGQARADLKIENYGLRLGYNAGSINAPYSSFGGNVTWRGRYWFRSALGFHVGASADIPLSEVEISKEKYTIGLNPCALFVSKGGSNRVYSGLFLYSGTYKISAYYLDIPVPVSIKRDFGSYKVRAELGPYFSLGLFGTQTVSIPGTGINYSQATFGEEGLSRVDAGLFYGAIAEFSSRYFVGLRVGSGFTDESVTSYYLTLGYNITP